MAALNETFCNGLSTGESQLLCNQLVIQQNANAVLQAQVAAQIEATTAAFGDIDVFYILWAGALVFMMHLGFAMLSAGAVRTKNTKNILLCILIDACTCAVAWWAFGYGFAYGTDEGGFIGTDRFFGVGMGEPDGFSYQDWFFQFAFAATAATIVSGAVAERATFEAYITYSILLSIWVYPVVVHWVWNSDGFLATGPESLLNVGVIDFAGCGPVHMVGGVAGAIGSKIIGPRVGRFDSNGKPVDIPGHSAPLAFLGVFILWVGWFGFNAGSTLSIVGNGILAERAVVNTMLSSATGALSALFFRTIVWPGREWDINAALNGTLAGLVAITSGCPVVDSWAALLIGAAAGPYYIIMSRVTIRVLKIDDPLDATPVHFFCGMFGLLVTGLFAKPEFVQEFNSDFVGQDEVTFSGIFYGGNGSLLLCQLIEMGVIIAWVGFFITPYFLVLRKLGWLRIPPDAEESGIDESSHGGSAYPGLYPGEVAQKTVGTTSI